MTCGIMQYGDIIVYAVKNSKGGNSSFMPHVGAFGR